MAGAAKDRDLLGCDQEPADDRNLEDRLFAQEEGRVPVVVQEMGEGERVGVRDVVRTDDEPTTGREVLCAPPDVVGDKHHHRTREGRKPPV